MITNKQKAREYMFKEHLSPLNNILHQCDINIELQYAVDIETAFIKGAEWKQQQMVEKAVDWLVKNTYTRNEGALHCVVANGEMIQEKFIEAFKKAMEE